MSEAAAKGAERLRTNRLAIWALGAATAIVAMSAGLIGTYRYLDNYWLYRGFAPPKDPTFISSKGKLVSFRVASPALGGRRQLVDVYLPPGYAAHPRERYPVVYLLHGFPGVPGSFFRAGRLGVVEDILVAVHKARPVLLVAPYGSTGPFTDKEWANGVRRGNAWETFLARDVVRGVDARYRTIRAGWARALVGLSEGGYGALNIGLHHPGEFRVLESWSGYVRADDISSIFDRRKALLRWNSPAFTLSTAAPDLRAARTFVWFYSGSVDKGLLKQNSLFARALARLHVDSHYTVVRGGHDWALWRGQAARALLAASERLVAPTASSGARHGSLVPGTGLVPGTEAVRTSHA